MTLIETAEVLMKPGAVAVIPTDTVYGLVARASDKDAVARLYELKQRENKPGTLIASSIEELTSLGIKRRYLTAVEQYWPGAVSIIIPVGDPTLNYLHQGKMSLAVRLPEGVELKGLLEQTGPLLTSSANRPGEQPATTAEAAEAIFGKSVDVYVNGGDLSDRQPSTIIRIVDDAVEIIRPGAVEIKENE
jgi:L-threonylcarbamoyladenylate synthase